MLRALLRGPSGAMLRCTAGRGPKAGRGCVTRLEVDVLPWTDGHGERTIQPEVNGGCISLPRNANVTHTAPDRHVHHNVMIINRLSRSITGAR
jgi:hypothetical protein